MSILPFKRKNSNNHMISSALQQEIDELLRKCRETYVPYDPNKDPVIQEFRRGVSEIRKWKR